MNKNNDQRFSLFRVLAFCGFIALTVGTTQNLLLGSEFYGSILYPATCYLTPLINGTCALLSLLFLFSPHRFYLLVIIMLVQSVYDVLTGFYILGIFIYAFFLVFLFCKGYGRTHFKKKATFSIIFWFLVLSTLIFSKFNEAHSSPNFTDFFFACGISMFAGATYVTIYKILADQLSFLVKEVAVPDCHPEIALPQKGQNLILENLGLTARQIACIHYTLDSSWNYKRIADILCTSESTIKKEMQELYRLFGVKNRELLRLLLIQYKIQ